MAIVKTEGTHAASTHSNGEFHCVVPSLPNLGANIFENDGLVLAK